MVFIISVLESVPGALVFRLSLNTQFSVLSVSLLQVL